MKTVPNYINHVALVLDASSSMTRHTKDLVRIADDQVHYLADRSKVLDQETRVSIYAFSYAAAVRCLVYDKDVLRLPSIASLYRADGMTALIDATLKSQDDLALTPEIYGDHSFLTFVLTDGMENDSRHTRHDLRRRLESLPDHWTVAVLVPDQRGVHDAKQCGFPAGNIAVWDTSSAVGLEDSFMLIRRATDDFMEARATGVRGTRSVFSTGVEAVNRETIQAADLKPLRPHQYKALHVSRAAPIREYVESMGLTFRVGSGYYQLTKTETIQAHKAVAIVNKATGDVYTGANARSLLGLPDMDVRVRPQGNPEFDVFVQSTSVNRKLVPGTILLLVN